MSVGDFKHLVLGKKMMLTMMNMKKDFGIYTNAFTAARNNKYIKTENTRKWCVFKDNINRWKQIT